VAVIGAGKTRLKLDKLKALLKKYTDEANRRNGEDIVRLAKVLIPVGQDVQGDGHERDKITGTANPDGSYLVDFGPKSKVIEGERGPRPFVNPALSASRKRRAGRGKRAVNKAAREAARG